MHLVDCGHARSTGTRQRPASTYNRRRGCALVSPIPTVERGPANAPRYLAAPKIPAHRPGAGHPGTSTSLAHAEDTRLQTVTVQAEQTDDDALPTRPPASIYGGLEAKVLDTRAQSPRSTPNSWPTTPSAVPTTWSNTPPASPRRWPERRDRPANARAEHRGVPGRPARLRVRHPPTSTPTKAPISSLGRRR
jgi:hypothetical protein